MTARSTSPLPLCGVTICFVVCLLVGLPFATAAQAVTSKAINLCIERAGVHKGTVRLISVKAHCKSSERGATFLTAPGRQRVLGAEAESGTASTVARGLRGEKGPRGDKGPRGEQGPRGPAGAAAAREIRGGGAASSLADAMGSRYFGPAIDMGFGEETAIQEVLPSGGTVSDLRVYLSSPPGGSDGYTFTVRRDPAGAASPVATALACTIEGSSTGCEDKGAAQTFAAGDAISIAATEDSSPNSVSGMFFRLDYQP